MHNDDIDIAVPPTTVPVVPPPDAPSQTTHSPPKPRDEIVEQLKAQGFTTGLAEAVIENAAVFPMRIWVVDNSGSMATMDGHRIVATAHTSDVKLVPCTRWAEIQETVEYHAQLAALLETPTMFRLLNDPGAQAGPQQFSIAERGSSFIPEDLEIARNTIRASSPTGVTPLARHLREIRASIVDMAPNLVREGKKVVVVLATDGVPTTTGVASDDEKREFIEAMRALEELPVWVVIRLCTDKADVVDFYNEVDSQLERKLEVLNDLVEEAQEIYEHNKWLNYTLQLHRCREMGYHHRIFDLLDERSLAKDEVRDFCRLLFGEDLPDPAVDWKDFLERLSEKLKGEQNQWHPIKKKVKPWISLKKLNEQYGDESCTIM